MNPTNKLPSLSLLLFLMMVSSVYPQWLLVPMDNTQVNHLKAYGLTYWTLEVPREYDAKWFLNYRGGSFLLNDSPDVQLKAQTMGVSFQPISTAEYGAIQAEMDNSNMDEILLEKAPKIAVYAPSEDSPYRDPWDDAVKIALEYAEIPYDTIWDKEVEAGDTVYGAV